MALLPDHLMLLLTEAGVGALGAAEGWRVGAGRMLDQPDTQITLYDSPGQTPNPLWLLDYPFMQVMVRGAQDGYQAARQKAQDCYDVLLGCQPRIMSNRDRIDAITVVGTPSFIGNDAKNRPMISANYRVIFEPAPSTLTNRLPL
jgi:hypothetical protein